MKLINIELFYTDLFSLYSFYINLLPPRRKFYLVLNKFIVNLSSIYFTYPSNPFCNVLLLNLIYLDLKKKDIL